MFLEQKFNGPVGAALLHRAEKLTPLQQKQLTFSLVANSHTNCPQWRDEDCLIVVEQPLNSHNERLKHRWIKEKVRPWKICLKDITMIDQPDLFSGYLLQIVWRCISECLQVICRLFAVKDLYLDFTSDFMPFLINFCSKTHITYGRTNWQMDTLLYTAVFRHLKIAKAVVFALLLKKWVC